MYREKLNTLRNTYMDELQVINAQLQTLPSDDFYCSRNGKYYKWIRSRGSGRAVIPKKDRPYAEKLAYKKYLSLRAGDLQQEIEAIDHYLKQPSLLDGKAEKLLANPPYSDLLKESFTSHNQQLTEWCNSEYKKNESYPEHLKHKSISGNIVRSKSELLIDIALYRHSLPFRYECELDLNGAILYPDFTIRRPDTLSTIYWEHFGMMDNAVYARKAYEKLQIYAQNGIIPDINLITTFEAKYAPLTWQIIESKIAAFLM